MHESLEEIAVEAVLSPPQRPEASGHPLPMILNGSYLVADAEQAGFEEAVTGPARELPPSGIELRMTGPWPPYSFVPGAIGAAW